MAKSKRRRSGVWGIDIGQCGLKALRCTVDDEDNLVADAFDYIEYPKVLSQPEANADELIQEALEQFLSRNEVKGDKVAVSVSGQAGLSRFFKPPPVDAKMIPDIVKYEARQQIPFALEDVIWDYQRIGGTEVDGFVMDAEVGIFAMKRDAVFRALQPFLAADLEISVVQLAPLAIFNVVCNDVLGEIPEEFDPDNPPESWIVLSMGTETTDLVITNGHRVWQRNIPLGGNHFTKQLTKELKLTYAKAEHLKRNARQAEDPKTVFQVMRPVFNDLVTEIQRSVGFFQSIDRKAKIGKMIMLGNAVKLPGLRQYLSKNLGHEVVKLDAFERLQGSSVVESKSFKDNLLSFAVCYGLCLQGLDKSTISTNLLPREFLTERLIREKKPWAVAALGALLLGFSCNYYFIFDAWARVEPERQRDNGSWQALISQIDSVKRDSDTKMKDYTELENQLKKIKEIGDEVVGDRDRKLLWLELTAALLHALPKHDANHGQMLNPKDWGYQDRPDMQIDSLETNYVKDLKTWYTEGVKAQYEGELRSVAQLALVDAGMSEEQAEKEAAEETEKAAAVDKEKAEELKGPTGPGWIIEMKGYHYHNGPASQNKVNWGASYIRRTLLKNLRQGSIMLPNDNGVQTEFEFKELGIGYPILTEYHNELSFKIPNPNHPDNMDKNRGARGARGDRDDEKKVTEPLMFPAPRTTFTVQFVWREKPMTPRMEEKRKREEEARKKAQGALPAEGKGSGEAEADAPGDPAADRKPDEPAEPAEVNPQNGGK